MRETDSIGTLKGIGPKTKEIFLKAGIETVEDLLRYYPKRYEKMENPTAITMIREGDTAAICASLAGPFSIRRGQMCIRDRSGKKKNRKQSRKRQYSNLRS